MRSASAGQPVRIGIDLGGTKIAGALVAGDGSIVRQVRAATPQGAYQTTLQVVAELAGDLASGLDYQPTVGVGTPGSRDPLSGRMRNCNSTWLNGQRLLDDLQALLGPRVRIANDANCFALSEAVSGSGAGAASVFGVILGTGVGGGWVLDGKLAGGAQGLGGEWGHIPLPYFRSEIFCGEQLSAAESAELRESPRFSIECSLDSRECYCGRLNCIETFLSGPGLARTYEEINARSRSPAEIGAAGDPESRRVLDLYVHMLARSLAQMVNVLDPQVIVLGGGLSQITGLYAPVRDLLPRFVFRDDATLQCATRVLAPRWGAESGVRGAAWLWQDHPRDDKTSNANQMGKVEET